MAQSYGRGGAGNMNARGVSSPSLKPTDLQTPALKSPLYTTGRGGSGNMAINDPSNPAEARAAQDIEAPVHHSREMQGTYHWGRGGEGNMTVVGKSERQQSKEREAERKKERTLSNSNNNNNNNNGEKPRRPSFQTAISKGKEILGLKDNKPKEGSAVKNELNESAIE